MPAQQQGLDGVVAILQDLCVADGPLYPALEQTAAHCTHTMVHDAGQCVLRVPGQAFFELEVASRRAIHDDRIRQLFDGNR